MTIFQGWQLIRIKRDIDRALRVRKRNRDRLKFEARSAASKLG